MLAAGRELVAEQQHVLSHNLAREYFKRGWDEAPAEEATSKAQARAEEIAARWRQPPDSSRESEAMRAARAAFMAENKQTVVEMVARMEAEQLDAAAAEAAEEEDTAAPWRRLDPVPAKELMDAEGWVFLDVRSARDYGRDAYKKAVSVPFFKMAGIGLGATAEPLLEEFLVAMREKYPCKDAKLIVVGGGDGQLGESALQVLLDEGYTCLIEMAGGYGAWTKLFRTPRLCLFRYRGCSSRSPQLCSWLPAE